MGPASQSSTDPTLDAAEVDRFARIAAEWWDPNGKFRPLHQIGPARLSFVLDQIDARFKTGSRGLRRLQGLSILDVGCGGGLICEPLARLGGSVTGLDPATESIAAAKHHASALGLDIDYRTGRVEDLSVQTTTFDVVLCLEVIEHVPDPASFLAQCAKLVRPGGLMIVSTINRTVKAYLLAIVGAEYVLRWLPVGTHQWERFVTPDELRRHLAAAGLQPGLFKGLVYNPLSGLWSVADDTDVNYMSAATSLAS
jgi:2-polyprenyl-6-hydroxyphenyl methylase / 3-demethylubiquinone-9 3-methyltransferase